MRAMSRRRYRTAEPAVPRCRKNDRSAASWGAYPNIPVIIMTSSPVLDIGSHSRTPCSMPNIADSASAMDVRTCRVY